LTRNFANRLIEPLVRLHEGFFYGWQ